MSKLKPLEYNLILVEGGLGQGKTTTATAMMVDAVREDPTISLFANFRLHGVRAMYMPDLSKLPALANTDLFYNGYLTIDESYMAGDRRAGMKAFNRFFTWFTMQSRKRKLTMILVVQNVRFLDFRFKLEATQHIICSYKKGDTIELTIRKRGRDNTFKRTFDASQYWKYFDTHEVPDFSDKQIAGAMESY